MMARQGPPAQAEPLSPIDAILDEVYLRQRANAQGKRAALVPDTADLRAFGLTIETIDGHCYERGEVAVSFPLHSLADMFVLALALQLIGSDTLRKRLASDRPAGRPAGDNGAPREPTAVLCTSLITEQLGQKTCESLRRYVSAFVGRQLAVNPSVYRARLADGERRAALAAALGQRPSLQAPADAVIETYLQLGSLCLNAAELALAAATFANAGTNPRSGERVIHPDIVPHVLSALGVANAAGGWHYRLELPTQSGAGSGLIAVAPGQLGLAAYSPLLDEQGFNSRGLAALHELAQQFGLQVLKGGQSRQSQVRHVTSLADRRSVQRRGHDERKVLDKHGRRVLIFSLTGILGFGAAEYIARRLTDQPDLIAFVVDLSEVSTIDRACGMLLADLADRAAGRGIEALFVGKELLFHGIAQRSSALAEGGFHPYLDDALEQAEDRLLARCLREVAQPAAAELGQNELLTGLESADIAWIESLCVPTEFAVGAYLMEAGTIGSGIYFLLDGQVRVQNAKGMPLAVLRQGSAVGDMALIDGGPRSADVVAMTPVEARLLTGHAFASIRSARPDVALTIVTNLCRTISGRLRDMQRLVQALGG